jgi:hypothetical protein
MERLSEVKRSTEKFTDFKGFNLRKPNDVEVNGQNQLSANNQQEFSGNEKKCSFYRHIKSVSGLCISFSAFQRSARHR